MEGVVYSEEFGVRVYCQNFSLLPLRFSWEVAGSSSGKNSGDGTTVFWYCHHNVPLDYTDLGVGVLDSTYLFPKKAVASLYSS